MKIYWNLKGTKKYGYSSVIVQEDLEGSIPFVHNLFSLGPIHFSWFSKYE